jgi:membrane fusion protein, multidrug efflux system
MNFTRERTMRPQLLALTALLVLSGCTKIEATPPAAPPTDVSVITVYAQTVEESLEFVGEVAARRTVLVRPRVSGVITGRPFREGAEVRAGDVLYRIETTTYEADYRSARAQLAEAEAEFANAVSTAGRLRPLLADNAVARQDVDDAETAVKRAAALIEQALAAVDQARKSLSETVVRAEISGRVGLALLDVGTRVSGAGDVLTTIDVVDPIYVSFRPSAQQQFRWKRDPVLSRAMAPGGSARVQALLPDSTMLPFAGRIGFIDPVVDRQTGTQQYRAEFPNAARLLLPGQFVRVRLRGLTRSNAIVVPQRAVLQQMGRQTVYVVDAANTVAARDVKATGWSRADWLIEQGLAAGERVVVDGVQKIGPGAVVNPTAFRPDTDVASRPIAAPKAAGRSKAAQ